VKQGEGKGSRGSGAKGWERGIGRRRSRGGEASHRETADIFPSTFGRPATSQVSAPETPTNVAPTEQRKGLLSLSNSSILDMAVPLLAAFTAKSTYWQKGRWFCATCRSAPVYPRVGSPFEKHLSSL
jgi:hypothetical protein